MSLYSYTALNAQKERTRGVVDAMSLQAARSALQETGLFVEEIHEATSLERESVKPWETEAVVDVQEPTTPLPPIPSYYPFLDTLRLYVGWLLAWYVLVIALGAYQETKALPFTIPLVEGLWQSVLIIRAAFGVFLFLMFTSLHRFFGSRKWVGGGLGLVGTFLFYVFLVNT